MTLEQAIVVLLSRMPTTVTEAMKLDFLERLAWILDDNGAELEEIRRRWVQGSNADLVELALGQWGTALSESPEEAARLLAPHLVDAAVAERARARLDETNSRP